MGGKELNRFYMCIFKYYLLFLKYKNTNPCKYCFFSASAIALLGIPNFLFPDLSYSRSNSKDHHHWELTSYKMLLPAWHVRSQYAKKLFSGLLPISSSSFCKWVNWSSETSQDLAKVIQVVNERSEFKCRQQATPEPELINTISNRKGKGRSTNPES